MAIDRNTFIAEIAEELEEYGEYDEAAGSALDTALLYAMHDFWEKRDWSIKFTSGEIVVSVDGNQGPYTPPSDFDSMVTPEVVSRYFDFDRFSVPPPIPDSSDGLKYELTWDRLNNRLYFRIKPSAQTYTFYYRKAKPTATSALSAWPPDARRYLRLRTMFWALNTSSDTKKDAKDFANDAEAAYKSLLYDLRRGESTQNVREPRDVHGYPLAQGYSNEGEGFLGGEG